MDKEKLAELLNEVFISGVAYGMARQAKVDAQEYHIVDEKTNKVLFSDFSASDLAISFYPQAIIPSALKNNKEINF